MKRISFSISLIFLGCLNARADCVPVDLRDAKLLPPQSQLYRADDRDKDSRYCYAHALAGLLSNAMGIPVAPRDIAIQHLRNTRTSKDMLFPLNFGWGGDIRDAFENSKKLGLCRSDRFEAYQRSIEGPDWYLALNGLTRTKGKQEIYRELDRFCGPRPTIPTGFSLEVTQVPFLDPVAQEATSNAMFEQVNSQLERGSPVVLGYAFHYVLIVGRTQDCRYIIQDSIPRTYREANEGFPSYYSETEGEHIQFWPSDNLRRALRIQGPNSMARSIATIRKGLAANFPTSEASCHESAATVLEPSAQSLLDDLSIGLRSISDRRP